LRKITAGFSILIKQREKKGRIEKKALKEARKLSFILIEQIDLAQNQGSKLFTN